MERSGFGRPVRWLVEAHIYYGGTVAGLADGFRASVVEAGAASVEVVESANGLSAKFELDGRGRDEVQARASAIAQDALRGGAAATPGPQGWSIGVSVQPRPAAFTIMGILNVTPDSFSDGGRFLDASAAVAHGLEMVAAGAANHRCRRRVDAARGRRRSGRRRSSGGSCR